MRMILSNGLVLEGTYDQVAKVASDLGYRQAFDPTLFHFSSTKGEYVLISDMDTQYLANAMFKIWKDTPFAVYNGETFANLLSEPHFFALLTEYEAREDK